MQNESTSTTEHEKGQTKSRKLLIWFLVALLIALLPWFVLGQDVPIKKEKFHLDKQMESGIGYTQAIKVGNTLYISGTVGSGPMDQSIKQVYAELEKTLKAYNATFANVVKENVFTTNLDEFKTYSPLRNAFYHADYPTASWIQIDRLYDPSLNLEVELVAVLSGP